MVILVIVRHFVILDYSALETALSTQVFCVLLFVHGFEAAHHVRSVELCVQVCCFCNVMWYLFGLPDCVIIWHVCV